MFCHLFETFFSLIINNDKAKEQEKYVFSRRDVLHFRLMKTIRRFKLDEQKIERFDRLDE